MARQQQRPIGRRLQARMMRVINVPMRVVLGLPFATPLSRRLMLVFLTGRKTGKAYRQPVSYVRQATTLLTPGGGKGLHATTPGPATTRHRMNPASPGCCRLPPHRGIFGSEVLSGARGSPGPRPLKRCRWSCLLARLGWYEVLGRPRR
jgi:hypothetical protein